MNIQISVHEWLQLPMDVRQKLRQIFSIPKSEGARVVDNRVESDGTTYKDLSVVTAEKMAQYLQEDSVDLDFARLFDATIARVNEELHPAVIPETTVDPKQMYVDGWVQTLSIIRSQAMQMNMEDYLEGVIKRVFNIKQVTIQQNAENKQKRKPGRPKKVK